jgi:flagellar basal-body rod protein FlgF
MIRGLYTSGWGMIALERKMDVIANNMANVDTNAYKKDTVVYQGFHELLTKRINDSYFADNRLGTMVFGSDVGEVHTNFGQGQLTRTGSGLDIAIDDGISGNTGFFVVGADNGNNGYDLYFTRDGSFSVSNNVLVTKEGHVVMGHNGPIALQGSEFTVLEDGTVMQEGIIMGRIQVLEFQDPTVLRKTGSGLYRLEEDAEPLAFSGSLRQGMVEKSNVNIIKEMMEMITVMRAYETNQRMVQIQDGTLGKAVNEVGAVR